MGKARLLIDNNVQLARMLNEFLSLSGLAVVMETDSKKALHRLCLTPQRFDIVVSDQTMPGFVGLEISQRLLEICPDVAIILCSGYNDHVNMSITEALGIKRYLLKPVKLEKLRQVIMELCDSLGITPPLRQDNYNALPDPGNGELIQRYNHTGKQIGHAP